MSKKPQYDPEEIRYPNQKIEISPLVPEMEKSYIEYAMSVIVGRALPDVRDGLKPVHRRILYAMYEDNLTYDHPFRKCATAVGDVLGRYHPHGDASVYDALVRLAQDFSMRYMLIDGHGNFGSVDGDPPAAYRYTEARMSRIADEMLRDIDKETVDWDPNFDETRKEPKVLPSRFPNLLVNGSSGIAVGMATNIPPHNMREVIGAVICVLDDPEATLGDLMQHIKGPDFPTKGIIMGRSGIRAAYATGRGRIVIRARHEFEEFGKDRTRIIITEIPYQVNKRMLIKNMAEQVEDKRLEGISNIQDESDRNGMRIVIELKRDANPQVVLNRLFAQTQLQTSFAVNMLALVEVDGKLQPRILSLRHILDEYIAYQEQVIVRRTKYDLKKARERAHLLEGLLIAQDNIDEVIKIIRSSYDNAKENLMSRFGLDDIQAQAILDMRLKALQGLDREKLENEYKELEDKIAWFEKVLADEGLVRKILKEELTAISEKYGDDRLTEIQDVEDEIDIEDLIEEEDCVFTLTQAGYIKRTPVSEYIFVTGGVVSGLGKGITAASLGRLLKQRGLRVKVQKLDPYLNVDPGTMSPYQHGEVFVTDDGAETDLDLGHYERFIDENLTVHSSVSSGKVYWNVLNRERTGDYLGATVQIIPHITNEIKRNIYSLDTPDTDVAIVEIGGTVGDIESQPFLESIRQIAAERGRHNVMFLHVSLIVSIPGTGELKSKPTQHSAKELLSLGIQPDVIICRSDAPVPRDILEKISLFCNIPVENAIPNLTAPVLYEVPLMLEREGLADVVVRRLGLICHMPDLTEWATMVHRAKHPQGSVEIALVGKYVALHDAYLSVAEALTHGGIENDVKVNIRWVDSETVTDGNAAELLDGADGVLVPGGFGSRGIEGKIAAVRWARESRVPFLGICLGMQMAVVEYARHVCGWADAHSSELDPATTHPVIDLMPDQRGVTAKGGTMRLGAYPCKVVSRGSRTYQAYGAEEISERHRHRYEFNNEYRDALTQAGLELAGLSPDGRLVEIVELPGHPWFVGVQFHPELKSRPNKAHPLFRAFIAAAKENRSC